MVTRKQTSAALKQEPTKSFTRGNLRHLCRSGCQTSSTIKATPNPSPADNLGAQTCTLSVLNEIPRCDANVGNNVRVAIIDTHFEQSTFLNHKVNMLGNFVDSVICDSHGGYLASIINEMIPTGNLEIDSIAVFDCSGRENFLPCN